MEQIYTDILKILDINSEEKFIKLSQELIKKIKNNKTDIEQLKENIKKEIIKLKETKLFRLNPIFKEDKIDKETLEFILKLIYKDKNIYKEIEELKNKKEKEKKYNDLKELKEHIKNTYKKLIQELEKIETKQPIQTKIPIIKQIKKQKQKKLINQKLDKIIEIIEESKTISENKNLKEELINKTNLKEILDILYKKCRIKEISDTKEIKKKLSQEYNKLLQIIESQIKKIEQEKTPQKIYDKRLEEYVYYKKNNYVTYIIDHITNEKNTLFLDAVLILKLITEIEEKKQITIQDTEQEKHQQKTLKRK